MAACAIAAGCYNYRVVPLELVPVRSAVRIRISAAEAERVGAVLGREDRVLDGELLAKDAGDGILLAVSTSAGADATGVGPIHQRISIPRAGVLEVEVRRLNKAKTAGVIAAVGAATAAAAIAAFGGVKSPFGSGRGGTDQ